MALGRYSTPYSLIAGLGLVVLAGSTIAVLHARNDALQRKVELATTITEVHRSSLDLALDLLSDKERLYKELRAINDGVNESLAAREEAYRAEIAVLRDTIEQEIADADSPFGRCADVAIPAAVLRGIPE